MPTLREAAEEFLAQPRLAVAGVSRDTKQPANLIYRRLRANGHQVFAVNPNADEVEGDRSYRDIASIPDPLDGVVIATTPAVAESVVAECVAADVPRVWLHRGIGPGSMSDRAVAVCREHGIAVIPGGCPNMGGATPDPGHKGLCILLKLAGKIPRNVETAAGTRPAAAGLLTESSSTT
jgi:predicted CoA-binding protein